MVKNINKVVYKVCPIHAKLLSAARNNALTTDLPSFCFLSSLHLNSTTRNRWTNSRSL